MTEITVKYKKSNVNSSLDFVFTFAIRI